MHVGEIDILSGDGAQVMIQLRQAFHEDMVVRYPGADYGPSTIPAGLHPPQGAFLVLYNGDAAVGCVGLRAMPDHLRVVTDGPAGEGKSLFVLPEYRGGIGAVLLLKALAAKAKELGYAWLYGNTGDNQPESLRLLSDGPWASEPIDLYDRHNPLAAHAFRIRLTP